MSDPSGPSMGLSLATLISLSAVLSLRNLPFMAVHGWSVLFFYGLAACFFLVPIGLICAELGATWHKEGGLYEWVKEALGPRTALIAVWLEWIASLVWLPMVLVFLAGVVAYMFNPNWAQDPYFMLITTLSLLWGLTFLNFLHSSFSVHVSAIGMVVGTLIPGFLILLLAASWLLSGRTVHIPLVPSNIVPEWNIHQFVFFAGLLLNFAGLEVLSFYGKEIKNPRRNIPRAVFWAIITIFSLSVLGALSIAFVVPSYHIELASGTMQAFHIFFHAMKIQWLVPIMGLLMALGTLALINTWILAPNKGLICAAKNSHWPQWLCFENEHRAPSHLLLTQGCSATVLTLAFVLMPSVSASYWLLTALTAQLMALMYVLILIAFLRLRYTRKNVKRSFSVPGGMGGAWFVTCLGLFGTLMAFFVGFFPPEGISVGSPFRYALLLIGGIAIAMMPPMLLKNEKKKEEDDEEDFDFE